MRWPMWTRRSGPGWTPCPPCLREQMLQADIRLETVYDLMGCLERVLSQPPAGGQKIF